MTGLMKSMLRYFPGTRQLDRYLQRHYAGCAHPEFVLRGSFHSPLPDLNEVAANATSWFDKEVEVGPSVDLRSAAQAELLREFAHFYPDFDWPEEPQEGLRYHLANPYFCHADAISLFCVMRQYAPKKVIEVGSGFSSALMLDVAEHWLGGRVAFTFIDPFPARLRSLLRPADNDRVEVVEAQVQKVPATIFDELDRNDILFIDSSHVTRLGSDVNYLFFEVLPRLKPGVLIHVHDIMWPFEYPQEWVLEGRAWNEVYLVRAFLQFNAAFEILLFNSYVAYQHRELLYRIMPRFLTNTGGSLWLRRSS